MAYHTKAGCEAIGSVWDAARNCCIGKNCPGTPTPTPPPGGGGGYPRPRPPYNRPPYNRPPYNRPDRPDYDRPNRPPYNRPGYGGGGGYGYGYPRRFPRPIRPMHGYGGYRPRRMYRPGYHQHSICRIVRQILIANPGLAGQIQEALMRHGIFCPGVGYGGYGGRGGNYSMNRNSGGGGGSSSYYGGCSCG